MLKLVQDGHAVRAYLEAKTSSLQVDVHLCGLGVQGVTNALFHALGQGSYHHAAADTPGAVDDWSRHSPGAVLGFIRRSRVKYD